MKLWAVVLLLLQGLTSSAQNVNSQGFVSYAGAASGGFPATQGDIFLPTGAFMDTQVAVSDLSVPRVPLPVADYTGNFATDAATYQTAVQRWLLSYPESLSQQDDVSQKLIALGYYDTLFKWQVQRNHINKLTK